jgi:NAD(P)-dependent dehydrogenase (short-subunit alcohol dehydrogenase family)
MASQYWDEQRANAYSQFRYEFPANTLRQKTVVVAGGSGGIGAATVALLAAEGAALVVGYRANRARAEDLRRAIQEQFSCSISLVQGDLADPQVPGSYLTAVQKTGRPLAGAAIFAGPSSRSPGRLKS